MIKKIHASNKMTFSSNVNDVIKAVLNSFFLRKDFTRTQKHKDRTEQKHKTLQANKNKKCA